jgi:phosphohistidine phosphatase
MKFFLMRHGDSQNGLDDAGRTLSGDGVREAKLAGAFLKQSGARLGAIYHSPFLRSRQTAEIVAGVLGLTEKLSERGGLLPGDSVSSFADEMEKLAIGEAGRLVVGHLPFVEDLASLLISGSEGGVSIRFTTGSLIGLERFEFTNEWILRFHITSKLISQFFDE